MPTEVDPALHLGLVHRVIGQMHLYGDMKEEAESEALVAIVEAAKSYDPSKNVPVANWLAKNIRWKIATWITQQRATLSIDASVPWKKINWDKSSPATLGDGLAARDGSEGSEKALSARTELSSLLGRMQVLLTQDERLVLLYSAAGYKGIEIAKMSGLSPVQVSLLKTGAQRKLREAE